MGSIRPIIVQRRPTEADNGTPRTPRTPAPRTPVELKPSDTKTSRASGMRTPVEMKTPTTGSASASPSPASTEAPLKNFKSPMSPQVVFDPAPFMPQQHDEFAIAEYFSGPRDITRHSRWPIFMRMDGSIMPKMIVPILFVGSWASIITVVDRHWYPLRANSVLLVITGFLVSLCLSLRSRTAYERYREGRRYWTQLHNASVCLGRVLWLHAKNPEGKDPREFLLKKVSSMNLVVAYAVAVMHSLRFEPYADYPDLDLLVGHLNTFARRAVPVLKKPPKGARTRMVRIADALGLSFAESNPRKAIKQATHPLGNLPLEIMNHIAVTVDQLIDNGQLTANIYHTSAFNNMQLMNDAMNGCERVLSTPFPIAYTIAISQITWLYVMLLPFQLTKPLGYVTIPATMCAAYIILGILYIGAEIENPFGSDVNDLPLESYCTDIAHDMDVIASYDKSQGDSFMKSKKNMPLYPVSAASYDIWMQRSEQRLREAIRDKPTSIFEWIRAQQHSKKTEEDMV